MHAVMMTIRLFEERVAELVEAKEIRTPCHLYIGQEAVAAGVCQGLRTEDLIWGTHRSHGHYIAKGGDLKALMAEIYCRATGCSRGRGGSMHLIAPEVGLLGTVPLVAATIPLAVGAGLASKLRKQDLVSIAFFGDGAAEEGHFHESLNLAALYNLPVIFVCENNLYASHMHIRERRPLDNLHEVGALYGIPGIRLDGNDAEAVHQAAVVAVDRARRGEGPSFLECVTFRWRGHVGPSWDMDVGVTRSGELKHWLERDPVKRLRETLIAGGASGEELDADGKRIRAEIEDSVRFAKNSPIPTPDELLRHVYYEAEHA